MIIVDASVSVKWVIDEPGSRAALAVLEGGVPLFAPDLALFEVTNAVIRAFRDGRLSKSSAKSARVAWDDLLLQGAMDMVPAARLYPRAVEMAFEIKHTLPDCLYLALAEECNGTLLTADRTLHDRGKKLYSRINMLSEAA